MEGHGFAVNYPEQKSSIFKNVIYEYEGSSEKKLQSHPEFLNKYKIGGWWKKGEHKTIEVYQGLFRYSLHGNGYRTDGEAVYLFFIMLV